MYKIEVPKRSYIIKTGEIGNAYYILQKGLLSVWCLSVADNKTKIQKSSLGDWDSFGEQSLLFNSAQPDNIEAVSDCIVWVLDSSDFKQARLKIMNLQQKRLSIKVDFLRTIDFMSHFHKTDLKWVANCCQILKYNKGDFVINTNFQNSGGNKRIYIVYNGECAVTTELNNLGARYTKGLYFSNFGKNIVATTDKCVCFAIDTLDFNRIVKNSTFDRKRYDESWHNMLHSRKFNNRTNAKLSDLKQLTILGVGTFSEAILVEDPNKRDDNGETAKYCLKKISKNRIVRTRQQIHIENERKILANMDTKFCVQLYGTYSDDLHVYFLMEAVLGGELYYLLSYNKQFPQKTAKFYAACVVCAFEHLHSKNIIYRDLKPENVSLIS